MRGSAAALSRRALAGRLAGGAGLAVGTMITNLNLGPVCALAGLEGALDGRPRRRPRAVGPLVAARARGVRPPRARDRSSRSTGSRDASGGPVAPHGPAAVVAAHGRPTTRETGRRGLRRPCRARARGEHGWATSTSGPTLESLWPAGRAGGGPALPRVGYHVRHDVAAAVPPVPDALVTPALGVEEEVTDALAGRVAEVTGGQGPAAGASGGGASGAGTTRSTTSGPVDAVVVTAAGSSVARARAEVAEVADRLGERLGITAVAAYLTGPGPRPDDEVHRLRAAVGRASCSPPTCSPPATSTTACWRSDGGLARPSPSRSARTLRSPRSWCGVTRRVASPAWASLTARPCPS